jgi:Circadian oscillating protein COP23
MKSSKIFLAINFLIAPFLALPQLPSLSTSSNISFNCYRNPSTKIYSTQIALASGEKYDIVHWEKYPKPKLICDKASGKFQDFLNNGKLTYIISGKDAGSGRGIVCGSANRGDKCDDQSKIFTLLPGTNVAEAVRGLRGAILGNSPIFQGSDDEIIISLQDLIKQLQLEKSQINK